MNTNEHSIIPRHTNEHQRTLHHTTRYELLVGVAREAELVSYRDSGSYASTTPIFNAEPGPYFVAPKTRRSLTQAVSKKSKQHNEYTELQCDKGQLLFTLVYNSDLQSILLFNYYLCCQQPKHAGYYVH